MEINIFSQWNECGNFIFWYMVSVTCVRGQCFLPFSHFVNLNDLFSTLLPHSHFSYELARRFVWALTFIRIMWCTALSIVSCLYSKATCPWRGLMKIRFIFWAACVREIDCICMCKRWNSTHFQCPAKTTGLWCMIYRNECATRKSWFDLKIVIAKWEWKV